MLRNVFHYPIQFIFLIWWLQICCLATPWSTNSNCWWALLWKMAKPQGYQGYHIWFPWTSHYWGYMKAAAYMPMYNSIQELIQITQAIYQVNAHIVRFDREVCCSNDTLDLYSGYAWAEFWPGYQLSWDCSLFFLSHFHDNSKSSPIKYMSS